MFAWVAVQGGKFLGQEFELRGLENVEMQRGGVVVVNHQSIYDIISKYIDSKRCENV